MTGRNLEVDQDVQAVLRFMQGNIPTAKLVGIADALPAVARFLWAKHPQEPIVALSLKSEPIERWPQSVAT